MKFRKQLNLYTIYRNFKHRNLYFFGGKGWGGGRVGGGGKIKLNHPHKNQTNLLNEVLEFDINHKTKRYRKNKKNQIFLKA